jgi:hypothetical protein
MVLPQRQTALVATQATDVDLLSGGQLRLGVGVGWNHVGYEALGHDFRGRGARQEEQIDVLRRLFTEPVVDFTGSFHRIDRASLTPKSRRSIPDLARWFLGGSVRPSRPHRRRVHLLRRRLGPHRRRLGKMRVRRDGLDGETPRYPLFHLSPWDLASIRRTPTLNTSPRSPTRSLGLTPTQNADSACYRLASGAACSSDNVRRERV